MKKRVSTGVIGSLIIVIGIVVWSWEPDNWKVLLEMKKLYIGIILSVVLFEWFLNGLKVKLFAKGVGEKIGIIKSTELALVDKFFGNITPSGIGGQPFKILAMKKLDISSGKASGIAIVELFVRVLFFLVCLPYVFYKLRGFFVQYVNPRVLGLGLFVFVSFIILCVYLFLYNPEKLINLLVKILNTKLIQKFVSDEKTKRIEKRLKEEIVVFSDTIWEYINKGISYIILGFLLTVLVWSVKFGVMYFMVQSLGYNLPYFQVFIAQLFVYTSAMFIPTPGGSGMEVVMYGLLKTMLPSSIAGLTVAGWRFFTYGLYILSGGIISLKVFHLEDKLK